MNSNVVLFIGNGINNFSKGYLWSNLLTSLCRSYEIDQDLVKHIPLTLLYENIFFKSKVSYKKENSRIKKKITDKILKIKHNEFHNSFNDIANVSDIITTNYDLNFEFSAGLLKNELKENAANAPESKYSLYRYCELKNKKKIWHIHGNIYKPDSIMLGYEHYVGQVEKIRRIVTKPEPENKHKQSWVDVFLNNTIVILGFGLDFSEIDIWWLLSYRRRSKSCYRNKIYLVLSNAEYESRLLFFKSLTDFDVELKIYVGNYYDLYKKCIDDINMGQFNISLHKR